AQHIPMRLPTDAHGEVAEEALMVDSLVAELEQRQNHQNQAGHHAQPQAVILPENRAIGGGEPVDQAPEKGEQVDFEHRNCGGKSHKMTPRGARGWELDVNLQLSLEPAGAWSPAAEPAGSLVAQWWWSSVPEDYCRRSTRHRQRWQRSPK